MFDYPFDERGIVKIIRIDVIAVDLIVEMEGFRIDCAAVASLNSAYTMLIVTPLNRAYTMLVIKRIEAEMIPQSNVYAVFRIIVIPPPDTETPASDSGIPVSVSGVPAHAIVQHTISASIRSTFSILITNFCIFYPQFAKVQKQILN